MTGIKTILHPTDFSEHSKPAFELACSLARDRGERVVVLHVVPSPMAMLGGTQALPPAPEELDLDSEKRQLAAIRAPDPAVPLDRRVIVGDPVEEILGTAADTGCELIVMGTHGRAGLGRLLMGSVAEQVVRRASCPVLTVKNPSPATEPTAAPATKERTSVTLF